MSRKKEKEKEKETEKEDETRSMPKLQILSYKEVSTGSFASKLAKYTTYEIQNGDLDYIISRRYNDFKWLRSLLIICYPGIFVPPMPPPVFLGRFADSFIQKRKIDLETFLLRLQKIEPFTKHDAYQAFMECDDKEFLIRKSEIDSNPSTTNPATATLALENIYPNLKEYIPNTEEKEFMKYRKSLQSIHEQMKVVDILGAKIHNFMNNISKEIPQFLNAIKTLYSQELKSGMFIDNDNNDDNDGNDVQRPLLPKYSLFFCQFEKYFNKIQQIFDQVFFYNLTFQHKDIIAFLEIFKQYDNNNKFYDKLCKSVQRWEEIEENNKSKNIELKPNQEKQKEADSNSKQDVMILLDLTRKIVLTQSKFDIAKFKTKVWKEKINQFYTFQYGLNQMSKYSHSNYINDINNDNNDKNDIYDDDDTKDTLQKLQLAKDENKTNLLQIKQLRKQIKILTKEADSLRNENIHFAIKKKENSNKNNNQSLNHQYDNFPTLSQTINQFEEIKNNFLSKPAKCIIKDIKKQYIDHSEQFIIKQIHEIMFEILFISFNKMKECEIDFYLKASKLYFIQDIDILRDLCKDSLQKTYLNIYNEIKENCCNDILEIIISSYNIYSFSKETKINYLSAFINQCTLICWQLILSHDGNSLILKPKTFDFEPKSKQINYNADIYDAFFGSHLKQSLNYVIFPAIYDKTSNVPLSKIYAMFINIIPKFSQQFVDKKLNKIQQEQYDTIRIIKEPEGASMIQSNDSKIVRNILNNNMNNNIGTNGNNMYKVYVGINFGYNEINVGYIDDHNKKKFNTIFKKYPSVLLNKENNELQGIGKSIFDNIDQNQLNDNYLIFNNFMITIAENKMIEIENKYNDDDNNDDDDSKQIEQFNIKDKNGKESNISLLFDVTLHYFWNSTLDVIKKAYLDKFNETIKENEIEWKISIPDVIYNICKPLLKQSGSKLGLGNNLTLIKETQAIATNYNIKLMNKNEGNQNKNETKFISILLNRYSLIIGCYKIIKQYKNKELIKPKINKNKGLNQITNQFMKLLTDIFDGNEFNDLIKNKPNKIEEIKLNFLKIIQKSDNDDLNENIFDNIFGKMLDSLYKQIDKLLKIKHIEGCKQHIIISGELSEIEYIQNKIRNKYNNDKSNKVKPENIHFAKSKPSKGTALFNLISMKENDNMSLTYRANKSWGISVQRDYIQDKDDKNRRIFNQDTKKWIVNGVYYEIIKKGQMVQANHCEVIWVEPIHKRKIQIDVYSNSSNDNNMLYIDKCDYEGSQSFELLKEWKNKNQIPIVFWCQVEENNKIRLHVCLNNLNEASSRIIDLRWTVNSKSK